MTHWEKKFDNFASNSLVCFYPLDDGDETNFYLDEADNYKAIKKYISTEIIEKLIDDIPDVSPYSSGLGSFNSNTELKQQLKYKWL